MNNWLIEKASTLSCQKRRHPYPLSRASLESMKRPVKIRSIALALPTARMRRWVPPHPGITPSRPEDKIIPKGLQSGASKRWTRRLRRLFRGQNNNTELNFGLPEHGLVSADNNIAHHRKLTPAPERVAVHSRNHWDGTFDRGEVRPTTRYACR